MGSAFSSTASQAENDNHEDDFQDCVENDVEDMVVAAQPTYRMEHAKSGRSKCRQVGSAKKCGDDCLIGKGAVRVGILNIAAGSYGKWQHLECWQVPAAVYRGLPKSARGAKEALTKSGFLSGFADLHPISQDQVLAHIANKDHWMVDEEAAAASDGETNTRAKKTRSSPRATKTKSSPRAAPATYKQPPRSSRPNTRAKKFVMPVPGVNGATKDSMSGKRFVLTGTFPELGGGTGLELGKHQVKTMIETFGGRVNLAISGLTTALVVGHEPGFVKVREARQRGIPMISLQDLQKILQCSLQLKDATNVTVEVFSEGYEGKGVAKRVSSREFEAVATGKGYDTRAKRRT